MRAVIRFLLVVALFLSPIVWEIGAGLLAVWRFHLNDEVGLLAVGKISFAAVLLLAIWLTGRGRKWGFMGGLSVRYWPLLWPIWAFAAISFTQDFQETGWWHFLVWLPIAATVAIGEEGIFRGGILTTLDPAAPRRAVLVSALLFGLIHLSALVTPLDWRMVVAQAIAAFGLGVTLGAVRLRSGSIWPGIIAHGLLDYTGLVAAGGLSEALDYSLGGVIFMLFGSAVAAGWGLVLCRKLRVTEGALPPQSAFEIA